MVISKSRLIFSDATVVVALAAFFFVTEHFTKNVLALSLVILILAARSIFFHVNHYKLTGKIY
jgi:hypothetical protein